MSHSQPIPDYDRGRILYVSPLDMTSNNGMLQRQIQWLHMLAALAPHGFDVLSLGAPPWRMRRWLERAGLRARVLSGPRACLAWMNFMAWYAGGVVLCNKLRWARYFRFPFTTPLPRPTLDRYERIVCYYPWAFHLLGLGRAESRVVLDTGDVMAQRHERIGTRRWISLSPQDEATLVRSGARCLAISEGDAQEFRRLYGSDLEVAPFCPAAVELLALNGTKRPRRAGFLAAPSYLNEEIIDLLGADMTLETLRQHGVELVVAGGICDTMGSTRAERLRAGGAQILGRVESLQRFYADVSVVLNPVGPSTGIKIKSVEALLAGCGLVTTRWGVDDVLQRHFASQIELLDWPVKPAQLAQAVLRATSAPTIDAASQVRAQRYVDECARALRRALGAA